MKQNQFMKRTVSVLLMLLVLTLTAMAQQQVTVTGSVVDDNGEVVLDANGDPITDPNGNFTLATLTLRYNYVKEGTQGLSVDRSSKVCVFGSTDFAGNDLLRSNAYGNTDLLLEIMRTMSGETFAVGINYKRLHQTAMGEGYYTDGGNRGRAVALALIPAVVAASLGIWVLVRRRRAA